MADRADITFYHSPNTRSSGVRVLLEELGVPYRLHTLNMRAGEHLQETYRAINPMAKVPAIRHGEAVVTEQAAVYLYLADLFPEAGLAPAATDDEDVGTFFDEAMRRRQSDAAAATGDDGHLALQSGHCLLFSSKRRPGHGR